MAKSSKKQCRKPKPHRQGGGLVVVTAQNLTARSSKPPPVTGKKGKKRKKQGSLLGDLAIDEESDDFDTSTRGSSPQPLLVGTGGTPTREYFFSSAHSRVQRLYYLLSTRRQAQGEQASRSIPGCGGTEEGGCHAVVFVEMAAVAQELVAELKALGLQAFVLHERTSKAQAQEHVKRFLSAPSADRSSVVLLTNAAITRSLSIGPVPTDKGKLVRVVHFDAPEGPKNEAARERISIGVFHGRGAGMVEEVHLEGGEDGSGLVPFPYEGGAMGGIRSRLAVAKKLSRAVSMSAGEGEERSMQRAASAAGLEWEAGAGQSESGEEAIKRERRRSHAQQATALREKMSVLLRQRLLLLPPSAAASGSTVASSARIAQQQNSKELRKKMVVLGMIRGAQGLDGGTGGTPGDRAAAQTRWLDGCAGQLFGGSWDGSIRTGASCDSASLDVRSRVAAAKSAAAGRPRGGKGGASIWEKRCGDFSRELAKWNPNPDTPDPEKWGGRWGKPCGHNEVVLQHLRPFAPMEVINTRVCSKASPAPGNTGFDGCVELLSLECRARERALTVWDDASFLYIDKAGVCSSLRKQAMLHLSLPTLRFLFRNMRSFTVCGEGREPPREVARAVIRSVGWGVKESKIGPLSAKLSTRVMSFVLTGDRATWRSVAAGFGVGEMRRVAPNANGILQNPTVAFSSKKKRNNFNL